MFERLPPETADLGELSVGELVDAARGWARAENAACARKLAVMAEIFARRTGLAAGDRELWWVDPDAAVAAELAAALDLTQGLALAQTHRGVALRDRLPRVAELFAAGLINDILVRTVLWRTYLITDDAAMAAVDTELAEVITGWGSLSAAKTEAAIDAMVDRHDPGALRRSRESRSSRTVEFGAPGDVPGIISLYARLHAADGAAMGERVEALAHSVCEADPRSLDERRNDAFAALGLEMDNLPCQCGAEDCQAAGTRPTRDTTVYVIADQATITEAAEDGPEAEPAPKASPAYVFGAGVLPTPLLSALVDGARLRPVSHPGVTAPEPRYIPSAVLAAFVRCRDLTCRFPGCNKPATHADIDHTVAYPVGPTHPSNLKCLCRFHHLLKTFWTGPGGWRDRQLPDGTVIWTSPTGHTYTTKPGSMLLFPTLCRPTATLWIGDPPQTPDSANRGAMMPKRRYTRAQNRIRAIAAERKLNDDHVAECNKPPPF